MSDFMQPETTQGVFYRVGDTFYPSEYFSIEQAVEQEHGKEYQNVDVEVCKGWFARLSAPGYLDCTDWTGPFDSEADALADLSESFGPFDDETES